MAPKQLAAAEILVGALRETGKLRPLDEPLIAVVLGMADVLDSPGCTGCGIAGCHGCGAPVSIAALWKEYRAACDALVQAGTADDVDDAARAFLDGISTPGPMPAKMYAK